MQRKGSALWKGGLKDGNGQVSTGSGGLAAAPYTFASRFESGGKTDPEELIAAAHAACFSMALSGQLGQANLKAESIATTANLTLEKTDAGMTVTSIHLAVKAASIFGPLTYGAVTWIFQGNHRLGILSVGAYFVVGLALLAGIDVERGRRAAAEA